MRKLMWEVGWSGAASRWYYSQKDTGKTQWDKPPDCSIDVLGKEPPSDKIPEEPIITVPGWEAIWDREAQAYYYYNVFNGVWKHSDGKVSISGTKLSWAEGDDRSCASTIEFGGPRLIYLTYKGHKYEGRLREDRMLHLKSNAGKDIVWVHEAETTERQWFNPSKHTGEYEYDHDRPHAARNFRLHHRHGHNHAKDHQQHKDNKALVGLLWDPHAFLERLAAYSTGDSVDFRAFAKTVAEIHGNNDDYIEKLELRIPETKLTTYDMCKQAVARGDVEPFVQTPAITASFRTVASAASFFALDLRRSVCLLNSSSGRPKEVARLYHMPPPDKGQLESGRTMDWKTLYEDYEGDLCRRIPNLYASLTRAESRKLYPFGPSTCRDLSDPQHYHSVLYTPGQEQFYESGRVLPGLRLARYGIDHGYECYPRSTMKRNIGVVSAAAPVTNRKNHAKPGTAYSPREEDILADVIVDAALLKRAISSIFIAPVLHDPRLTTIVIGPWGAQEAVTAERMGIMFGEAVTQPRKFEKEFELSTEGQSNPLGKDDQLVILGQLYHEVHFALPTRTELEKQIAEGFMKGLQKAGVDLRFIKQLGEKEKEF